MTKPRHPIIIENVEQKWFKLTFRTTDGKRRSQTFWSAHEQTARSEASRYLQLDWGELYVIGSAKVVEVKPTRTRVVRS